MSTRSLVATVRDFKLLNKGPSGVLNYRKRIVNTISKKKIFIFGALNTTDLLFWMEVNSHWRETEVE